MPLHNQCYEIETTLYLRSPRPAGGFFILAELDVTVTVSEDIDDGVPHHQVESIAFGTCEIDGAPYVLGTFKRQQEHCEIMRPSRDTLANRNNPLTWLWLTLEHSLDMQHISEEINEQKNNHF